MPTGATVTKGEADPRFTLDEAYAKECLATPPPEALQEDYMRFSADLAWWLTQVANAKREVALLKLAEQVQEAQADEEVRAELGAAGVKVTEKAVEARVNTHAGLLAAKRLSIEADHYEARVRAVADALRAKRDMLVGLGATFRAEVQADPSVRAGM